MSRQFVTDEGIRFDGYPFPPASVFPSGLVRWQEIEEADAGAAPPEIRLRSGEILFVSAERREELQKPCHAAGIPEVKRVDIWDLILEPFLDTQLRWAHKRATLRTLSECGIPRARVWRIRCRVRRRMLMYNAVVWEWVHLGLCDLLEATMGTPFPSWLPARLRLGKPASRRFYWWAMDIATKGRVLNATRQVDAADAECRR